MSGLTVAEVLDRAADKLTPPGRWIQNDFAVTKSGKPVLGHNPAAICFCALGAIQNVTGSPLLRSLAHERLEAMVGDVPEWNDAFCRTQAEVVAKLREAAAAAREVQS